jgi:hypothetical protein
MFIIYYNNILTSFTITYIVVHLQEYFIKVVDEHLTLNN